MITNPNAPQASSVIYQINAEELRDIIRELWAEAQQQQAQAAPQTAPAADDKAFLTRKAVARMFNVSFTTLWRWNKDGYLKNVRLAPGTDAKGRERSGRVVYRHADIEKFIADHQGVSLIKEEEA